MRPAIAPAMNPGLNPMMLLQQPQQMQQPMPLMPQNQLLAPIRPVSQGVAIAAATRGTSNNPTNAKAAPVRPAPAPAPAQPPPPRINPETLQINQPVELLHGAKPNPYIDNAEADKLAKVMSQQLAHDSQTNSSAGQPGRREAWGEPERAPSTTLKQLPDPLKTATLTKNTKRVPSSSDQTAEPAAQEPERTKTHSVSSNRSKVSTVSKKSRPGSVSINTEPETPFTYDPSINLFANTRSVSITRGSDGFGFVLRGWSMIDCFVP
jgi:hypothetical protein